MADTFEDIIISYLEMVIFQPALAMEYPHVQ